MAAAADRGESGEEAAIKSPPGQNRRGFFVDRNASSRLRDHYGRNRCTHIPPRRVSTLPVL